MLQPTSSPGPHLRLACHHVGGLLSQLLLAPQALQLLLRQAGAGQRSAAALSRRGVQQPALAPQLRWWHATPLQQCDHVHLPPHHTWTRCPHQAMQGASHIRSCAAKHPPPPHLQPRPLAVRLLLGLLERRQLLEHLLQVAVLLVAGLRAEVAGGGRASAQPGTNAAPSILPACLCSMSVQLEGSKACCALPAMLRNTMQYGTQCVHLPQSLLPARALKLAAAHAHGCLQI
jgi:hypothetical protein